VRRYSEYRIKIQLSIISNPQNTKNKPW